MKTIALILMCGSLFPNLVFLNKVLGDRGRHSFYVAVQVNSVNYRGMVIAENGVLFRCLNRTKGLSHAQYQTIIKEILLKKKSLMLGNLNLREWGLLPVEKNSRVDSIAERGVNEFLSHYFQEKVIRPDIDFAEKKAVIAKLFEFEVPVCTDDESGVFILVR